MEAKSQMTVSLREVDVMFTPTEMQRLNCHMSVTPSSLNLEEETPPPKQSCWRRRGFDVTILK
ncbi:hypothetical protein EYF80_067495 [Liparis tanakae]|uniref:Uncharacterized protein n=1 Tax=Liparis tanakae TaxID=230148 RepID=A0A4Z2E0S5_9TELE|nr:hypothetical protein EYF80_067495 [Liparis tanakae]